MLRISTSADSISAVTKAATGRGVKSTRDVVSLPRGASERRSSKWPKGRRRTSENACHKTCGAPFRADKPATGSGSELGRGRNWPLVAKPWPRERALPTRDAPRPARAAGHRRFSAAHAGRGHAPPASSGLDTGARSPTSSLPCARLVVTQERQLWRVDLPDAALPRLLPNTPRSHTSY